MADETTDVGHFEQLSIVFRYFDEKKNRPVETYITLKRMQSVTAQAIFDCLHDVLILMGKDWHSVLSVCFDGASTMAEKISKDVGIKLLTLKSCSITRWACRAEAVKSVLNNYEVLLLAIEEICESSSVPEMCAKGMGLKYQLKSFDFIFGLYLLNPILNIILKTSSLLQSPNMDLVLAVNSVQSLVQNLMAMRNSDEEFRNIYQQSVELCHKNDELISGINSRFNQEIVQLVQAVASMIRLDTTPVMISILSNFANVPVEKLQSEIKLLKYLPATDGKPDRY
ncbi:uncharacterized protein LOC103309778 [Acyrthosiphon pisum]|uniref:DUF4371 domain-containing protein n=1 Tax=Acyrthosiphon pisum TaxID=7029 RepID=A0A8R2F982_ACYPI|nr:uncharacterized protein LOC103309778 [Acyrthosiphon pisum]|eukprot:XP_008184309.1 PREDICTED: uncharacterized protein LOC103309778 [Acyrthosiphon pisum]